MDAHALHFALVQSGRFVENGGADANLSEVVEEKTRAKFMKIMAGELTVDLFCQRYRKDTDVDGVSICVEIV